MAYSATANAIRLTAGIQCWAQKPAEKVLVSVGVGFDAAFPTADDCLGLAVDLLFAAIVCMIESAKVAGSQKEKQKEFNDLCAANQ